MNYITQPKAVTNESSQRVTANTMAMHNLYNHLNMAFHNAQVTYFELNEL